MRCACRATGYLQFGVYFVKFSLQVQSLEKYICDAVRN